jgi:hypothetical protein
VNLQSARCNNKDLQHIGGGGKGGRDLDWIYLGQDTGIEGVLVTAVMKPGLHKMLEFLD